MRKTLYLLLALIILFTANDSFGQMNRKSIKRNNKRISSYRGKKNHFTPANRYNSIGISLNALNYYGDLSPKKGIVSTDISFTRPAIGISFAHRFGPRYTLTGTFMYGTLKGSDAKSADASDTENGIFRSRRNLSFRNRIKELSVVASFDLFENQATYISRVKWTPYVFLGVAGFLHNPQAQIPKFGVDGVTALPGAGDWVNLRDYGTEGQNATLLPTDVNYGIKEYKLLQIAIPGGIGARFRINEVLDFSAEFGFRYTFTDYLDDVSKNYVDLGVFNGDKVAEALSYRTNELGTLTNPNPYTLRNSSTQYVVE
ncbi:MAG TPA: DUF6089 family protein, partial [Chryseolinea sp.]|nr:DUF6089 family protein [Chryseolinea sp.]